MNKPFILNLQMMPAWLNNWAVQIRLTEGISHENIKITFPEDIAIAELLLSKKASG
jgi:2-C-methyl-D-erythritol 4-phosphate cytidylyltransferase